MTYNMKKNETADIVLKYTDHDGNPAAVEAFTADVNPLSAGTLVIDNVTGSTITLHFNPAVDGPCIVETHADGHLGEGVVDIPFTANFDVEEDAENVVPTVTVHTRA